MLKDSYVIFAFNLGQSALLLLHNVFYMVLSKILQYFRRISSRTYVSLFTLFREVKKAKVHIDDLHTRRFSVLMFVCVHVNEISELRNQN